MDELGLVPMKPLRDESARPVPADDAVVLRSVEVALWQQMSCAVHACELTVGLGCSAAGGMSALRERVFISDGLSSCHESSSANW